MQQYIDWCADYKIVLNADLFHEWKGFLITAASTYCTGALVNTFNAGFDKGKRKRQMDEELGLMKLVGAPEDEHLHQALLEQVKKARLE